MKTNLKGVFAVILLGVVLMVNGVTAPVAQARACVPGSSATCPIRISLLRGTYGTTVHGRLTLAPQQKYYALRARAGQWLTITFAGFGTMRGGINFPGGGGEGPFDGEGNTLELPATGDYILYLGQNTMAGEPWTGGYSLGVMIR